jgi:hypothetical protein
MSAFSQEIFPKNVIIFLFKSILRLLPFNFSLSLALETFYCNYFQIENIDQLVALTLSLKTAALNLPPN